MIVLSLQNINKSFGVNQILEDVSLTLQNGRRLGLVGVNGSGKSTLLKIIIGEELPDSGIVSIVKGQRIGYLTQYADIHSELTVWQEMERVFEPVKVMETKLRVLEEKMAMEHTDEDAFTRLGNDYARLTDAFQDAGGFEWPSRISGVLNGLGFSKIQQEQSANVLSGGERTRLCLARMLLQAPDIMLLDEPTNHLDLDATQWLEDTLSKFKGAVVVISHDRYFLDAVCTDVAELSLRKMVQYEGNYTVFSRKHQADIERQMKEFELQQSEIARQKAIIARYRMYNREKSIRAAESREKRLEKIELVERPISEQKVRFSFEAKRRTGDDVLLVQGLQKGFGDKKLFSDLNMHIRAGDRIALIGPNGVGKSTLFKIITKRLKADGGYINYGTNVDIGYYDQHQDSLSPHKKVLDEVWDDFPKLEQDEIRNTLALFLLTGDDVFQPVATLSGGEKGRVALTKLMLKQDNFLLLDEPTNHLDMDSREVLEGALQDFTGTLLIISHDRYFINKLANRIVEMRPDGVTDYNGNYDEYVAKKRKLDTPPEEQFIGVTKTQLDKDKRRQRLAKEAIKALRMKVIEIEGKISIVEGEIVKTEKTMSEPETYQDNTIAQELAKKYAQLQRDLEQYYNDWSHASEELSEQEI